MSHNSSLSASLCAHKGFSGTVVPVVEAEPVVVVVEPTELMSVYWVCVALPMVVVVVRSSEREVVVWIGPIFSAVPQEHNRHNNESSRQSDFFNGFSLLLMALNFQNLF